VGVQNRIRERMERKKIFARRLSMFDSSVSASNYITKVSKRHKIDGKMVHIRVIDKGVTR